MPFHGGLERLRTQLGILVERARGFAAERPIASGAAVFGLGALVPTVGFGIAELLKRRKRKKRNGKRKRTKKARGKKVTGRHRRAKRAIVRGRGLGRREIHHGHKGSKLVSFKTKDGKIVRFKVRGKSKRHK